MVSEIRRRASNKTTEDASLAIVSFLEMPSIDEQEPSVTSPTSSDAPANSYSSGQSRTLATSSSSGAVSSSADKSNNNNQRGWILLSTLNLLVCNGSAALIPIMASTSLPSTLVKCLYLFFDLPAPFDKSASEQALTTRHDGSPTSSNASPDENDSSVSSLPERLTSRDRRLLLQRVFAQLLTRLCAHQSSLHELTRFVLFLSWPTLTCAR